MLAMAGALLVGLFAMLGAITSTPEDSFLLGMFVVIAFILVSVPVGIAQLTGLIMGIRAHRRADSEDEQALATWGIVLNGTLCLCLLFLPLVVLGSIT